MATLFVVSTPIGNLGDVTRRASEVLASVGRVLAEDTRHTRRLLDHLGIRVPMTSLHAHNEASRRDQVMGWLDEGVDLALVSDAGTPLISDPGARVVHAVIEGGHAVVPIPGPSAVLAALVASGLPADRFAYLGFVPRRGPDRRALLERVARAEETIVLFESPERLIRLLEDLSSVCGGERRVAVARELTKLHETVVRGTLNEARSYYEGSTVRGEVSLVVEARPRESVATQSDHEAARALARSLLDGGASPSGVAREVSRQLSLPRNLAYEIVQEAKDG